ncbi:hypothetical protein Aduo_015586 [Ancylostoma duodenale]
MPLLRGVLGLLNPFSWFASRAECKEDFVQCEIEVQDDDLPEHWEVAAETCDGSTEAESQKSSCKGEDEQNELGNGVSGDIAMNETPRAAEIDACSDGNDEGSALEECCCPSVGLDETVKAPPSNIICQLVASPSGVTQVDQLCPPVFIEEGSQDHESFSVDEWNEQGTANGSQISQDHMVSSTEMSPVVHSSMKKKRTMDADINLHKPNLATATSNLPKSKRGKGAADRAVSEKPPAGEEPEILVVESPYNVEAFGRKNIGFTSSAKKRKATGDRSFVEEENCIVYEMDLEAILSRRRFADWSWDIEEDSVAPATKRLRSDEDVKLAKDKDMWCDAQVQPTCDAKMDVDVSSHEQMSDVKASTLLLFCLKIK